MERVVQCSKVLMMPEKLEDIGNPYLRPDHEVDLSLIAPPSDQGELLAIAILYLRVSINAYVAAGYQALCLTACSLTMLILPDDNA